MNILWLNLRVDENDQVLAFALDWINKLAEKVDKITVLTMAAGSFNLRDNVEVHSLGKERGFPEVRRFFRFYRLLFKILKKERIDAAFAHMTPVLAAMAGPVLKVKKIPLYLWYTHGSVNLVLRAAVFFSRKVLTATEQSFRLKSRKKLAVGHGIDTGIFRPGNNRKREKQLLHAGRISPVKQVHLLPGLLEDLSGREGLDDIRLVLAGDAYSPGDRAYLDSIREEVESKGFGAKFVFLGTRARAQLIELYRQSTILLNFSETHGLDKVLIEAMACGCIPVTGNKPFKSLYGERFPLLVTSKDPGEAVEKIAVLLGMKVEKIDALRRELVAEAAASHSLDRLAGVIYRVLRDPDGLPGTGTFAKKSTGRGAGNG